MSLSLLRLQSLGPKELLEDFDVLSKWIDCASWYSPAVNRLAPTILSPVMNAMRARRYRTLDHMLRKALFFSLLPSSSSLLQLCKWLKKIWLLFPAVPYLRRRPFDVWGCMWASNAGAGFCYLTASATSSRWAFMSDAPSGHGVC